MHSIKATLILSLTTLILLASYIVYNSHQDRFVFLPLQADKSIYVFDRKNNVLNYCTSDNQCKVIKLSFPIEQMSSQNSILPASFLKIIEGKRGAPTETNAVKNPADQKNTVTVSATHIGSAPAAKPEAEKAPPAKEPNPPAKEPNPPAQEPNPPAQTAIVALPNAGQPPVLLPSDAGQPPAPTLPDAATPPAP